MQELKNSLNIDNTYSKLYRKTKKTGDMNHVKENIYLQKGYNYQADILHLPTDKFGWSKLLIVVDMADDSFDIEKMKDSEAADLTLSAYKRMLDRKDPYISIPLASLTTDGASSFGASFHSYLKDNGVRHKVTRAGRHKQMANIDNLCRQLGDLFNGAMNAVESKSKKMSRAWTQHIATVRTELNYIRTKSLPRDITTVNYNIFDPTISNKAASLSDYDIIDTEALGLKPEIFKVKKPKYKIGDEVNIMLSEPEDALGNKQSTKVFRMGDFRVSEEKYTVRSVLYYAGVASYRYLLDAPAYVSGPTGKYNKIKKRVEDVSFTEDEMKQL